MSVDKSTWEGLNTPNIMGLLGQGDTEPEDAWPLQLPQWALASPGFWSEPWALGTSSGLDATSCGTWSKAYQL